MGLFFKKFLLILTLCCASFFLLDNERVLAESQPNNASEYQFLIKTYQECVSLENEIFRKLTFKLYKKQLVRQGIAPKISLEDNLGRKWIFKPLLEGMPDKPIVVYRILKLFGINCPEIHPITLNINGKDVYGGIQRFIPNKGNLAGYRNERLSSRSINYLMDTHVFFWLLGDYDAHASNFIVLSITSRKEIGDIVRVDNDSAFHFNGRDNLNLINGYKRDWVRTYYCTLWEATRFKKVSLDIKANYAFVKFVENFPDYFICRLMQPLIIQNQDELANPDFSNLNLGENDLIKTVILRKKHLSSDFLDFYKYLVGKKKKVAISEKDTDYKKNITRVCSSLINRINTLKKEQASLSNKLIADKQLQINAIFSLEGFKILSDIYKTYWGDNGKGLTNKCTEALAQLSQLQIFAVNKYEKAALKIYMDEVRKIRRVGGTPSVNYNFINSIVNPAEADI